MTYISGKYDSARDEFLDLMVAQGWANKSGGDVESNAGHFALINNSPAEITEIVNAFDDEMTSLNVTPFDVTGHFVVETNSQGFVTVHAYETETAADIVYSEFERSYSDWLIATGE